MNYKKAFKCGKCPQTNTDQGCPMWWEYMQVNNQTGEEKLQKSCGYQALPNFLIEVIKASNRPAAEMGALRADMVQAVTNIQLPEMRVLEHD